MRKTIDNHVGVIQLRLTVDHMRQEMVKAMLDYHGDLAAEVEKVCRNYMESGEWRKDIAQTVKGELDSVIEFATKSAVQEVYGERWGTNGNTESLYDSVKLAVMESLKGAK